MPTIGEAESAASDQVPHGRRGRDSTGLRLVEDPAAEMNPDASDVAVSVFDLPEVDARAALDAESREGCEDLDRRLEGCGWSVEDREGAVSGRLDDTTAETGSHALGEIVMRVEHGAPSSVPCRTQSCGGCDEVGEEYGG